MGCQRGGLQNTLNNGAAIDYERITVTLGGSIADFYVQLQKPRHTLFFLLSTTGANPNIFLSFVPTGQGSLVQGGAAFNANAAINTPAFEFASQITFKKPIQNFYLSIENNNNPGTVTLLALDDLETIDNQVVRPSNS